MVRKTLAIEGPLAFYKGLSATFVRAWAAFRGHKPPTKAFGPTRCYCGSRKRRSAAGCVRNGIELSEFGS